MKSFVIQPKMIIFPPLTRVRLQRYINVFLKNFTKSGRVEIADNVCLEIGSLRYTYLAEIGAGLRGALGERSGLTWRPIVVRPSALPRLSSPAPRPPPSGCLDGWRDWGTAENPRR